MKKINKLILAQLVVASSCFGTYRAIQESYKLSCDFLRAKQIIQKTTDINELVKIESYSADINPVLIRNIIRYENRKGKNWATRALSEIPIDNISRVGAVGLMQVMPDKVKFCGLKSAKELFEPSKNIRCGVKVFKENLKNRKDVVLATAEYNGGHKGFNKSKETTDYKREVLLAFANDLEK